MEAPASPAADAPLDPPEAPPERLAWGFPAGCAIVAAVGFFVPYGFVPRPAPPEPLHVAAGMDPFAEPVPYSPEAIASAEPLVDPRWFLPSKAPAGHVRLGPTTVSGRLPPEVVQRVVRQGFGRYRACYQAGLQNNPNLAGRVGVRLVIGRDGSVTNVGNGGSDLPDARVVTCVVRAFQGLSFPRPEGGLVTVIAPIQLSP